MKTVYSQRNTNRNGVYIRDSARRHRKVCSDQRSGLKNRKGKEMNRFKKWVILKYLNNMENSIKEGKMIKRGVFTTEFWLTLVTTIITAFADQLKMDPQVRDAIIRVVVAYVASRTAVKVSDVMKK